MGEAGKQSSYVGGILSLDATSASTQVRIANYNAIINGIPIVEALIAGQVLVPSYLYSAKPSWFGTLPWPWCEPTNFAQSNDPTKLPAGYRAIKGVSPGQGPALGRSRTGPRSFVRHSSVGFGVASGHRVTRSGSSRDWAVHYPKIN